MRMIAAYHILFKISNINQTQHMLSFVISFFMYFKRGNETNVNKNECTETGKQSQLNDQSIFDVIRQQEFVHNMLQKIIRASCD